MLSDHVRAEVQAELDRITEGLRQQVLTTRDEWPEVTHAVAAVDAARAAARRAVLERGVLQLFRDWINEQLRDWLEARLNRTLEATTAPGLAELPNPDHEVPTPESERLELRLSLIAVWVKPSRGSASSRCGHAGRLPSKWEALRGDRRRGESGGGCWSARSRPVSVTTMRRDPSQE